MLVMVEEDEEEVEVALADVEVADAEVELELEEDEDDEDDEGHQYGNQAHQMLTKELVPRASRPRLATWEAVALALATPVTAAVPLAAGA